MAFEASAPAMSDRKVPELITISVPTERLEAAVPKVRVPFPAFVSVRPVPSSESAPNRKVVEVFAAAGLTTFSVAFPFNVTAPVVS